MLRAIRLCASPAAAAVLVALLSATASQALSAHGLGEHDSHYAPSSAIPHSESDHRIDAADANVTSEPLHCLVCHWARAFRPIRSIIARHVPHLEVRATIHVDDLAVPITLASAQLTLRSPPSSLFVL